MVDFRRLFTALALLALFAGLAAAQATTGGNISCTQSLTVTPTVRGEGLTELVGDIVLGCSTTGTPIYPAAGSAIQTANITVFLTNPVTSRIMSNNSAVNASEALLLIDEPGSSTSQGYGTTVTQTLCPTPQGGGCTEYNGTTATSPAGALVPVQSGAAGPQTAGWNMFQGVVSGNSVTFYGVPILPPNTAGATHVYRITNIRVNANQGYNASSPTPSVVQASISISPSTAMTIPAGTVYNVAYVSTGLNAATRKTDNSGDTSSTVSGQTQCGSLSTPGGPAGNILGLRFSPGFPTAFKPRISGAMPAGATVTQNIPGQIYNSETGFTTNIGSTNGITTAGSTGSVGTTTGLADWGTRLKAVFNNIPSGVTIWVSSTNFVGNTTTLATSANVPFAQAVISETAPDSNNVVPAASTVSKPANYVPLVMTNATTGYAVWEVENINSTVSTGQDLEFGVAMAYGSGTFANTAAVPISVNMSLAPNATNGAFSTTTQATATTSNVPRFVDTSAGKTVANIGICQTTLLFPYVTTVAGFDTGLAVANTSQDPFGTVSQNGTCTFNWYEAGVSGTNPPAFTTPVINAGTVYAFGAVSETANTQFTGYAIAVCNFNYGHGYAAVTDVGARSILSGYLPLIIQNSSATSRTGGGSEALEN